MKKVYLLILLLVNLCSNSIGQNSLEVRILDSVTSEPIYDATIRIALTDVGAKTDFDGRAILNEIPNGSSMILISSMGYLKKELLLEFPRDTDRTLEIFLVPHDVEIEEIIIEATRANRTVANLPTRTEVLTEEIDEAASMEPSKIAHLITHSTGIQVQTTSATSNGAVVRIQGLNGRYTQMLKDGFPLYGGFSGSLDILQIPPLDLRQVEYIKGSASTLYGGGAIGGIINLLTKKPTAEETLVHLNVSHIGAKDFNAFVSKRIGKFGFTNLASMHLQSPYDPDNDGYSDVPEVAKFNFNHKLFYYPDEKTVTYLGIDVSREDRMGGDLRLIDNQQADSLHYYYDKQRSSRFTTQFKVERSFSKSSSLTLKNSVSLFNRYIEVRENVLGETVKFGGNQLNSFSELNYSLNKTVHNLNIGLNIYTDDFTEDIYDTIVSEERDQKYLTFGFFANHLWDLNEKVALETGLRTDLPQAKGNSSTSSQQVFVLPRISALYKINRQFSIRLGGGMGYRMPTIFNEEAEPFAYKNIRPIDFQNVEAERSYGVNFDFKYRTTFGSDNMLLTFNQMFFYNQIDNPVVLQFDTTGMLFYDNSPGFLFSRGFETQIKLTVWKFTWFLGYTYTDFYLEENSKVLRQLLTPAHSIKGDLLFVIDGVWRIGWDYEYKSEQLLSGGIKSESLFMTGIVVERTIGNFVIFLNAENFTDTRQTRYGSLRSGPYNTPQFTDIWAPLDGFFFNAGLKIKL